MPHNSPKIIVALSDLGPLSFEVRLGTKLSVRRALPTGGGRPTVRGQFQTTAYIVYDKHTKVGLLPASALEQFGNEVPEECIAMCVDRDKNSFRVSFLER